MRYSVLTKFHDGDGEQIFAEVSESEFNRLVKVLNDGRRSHRIYIRPANTISSLRSETRLVPEYNSPADDAD